MTPQPTTGIDLAFGPQNISKLLPPYASVPQDAKTENGPAYKLMQKVFCSGASRSEFPPAREGINRDAAINHILACLRSFEPKHEHKMFGCAHLANEWFQFSGNGDTDHAATLPRHRARRRQHPRTAPILRGAVMQIIRDVSPTEQHRWTVGWHATSLSVQVTCTQMCIETDRDKATPKRQWDHHPEVPADVREEALRRVRESVRWEE